LTTAASALQPELAPVAVALGAADYTMTQLDSVFASVGLPERKHLNDEDLIKHSAGGKWTEQFLFGDLKGSQIPDSMRNKVEEDLKKEHVKKHIAGYLTDKGIPQEFIGAIK
jgi:hypothetical protein